MKRFYTTKFKKKNFKKARTRKRYKKFMRSREKEYNEIIAGIREKDLQSFKLVRLILDREVQVSTKTT